MNRKRRLDLEADALAQVNVGRALAGLETLLALPKGEGGNYLTCPIALALGPDCGAGASTALFSSVKLAKAYALAWHGDESRLQDNVQWHGVTLPFSLRLFIAMFDHGDFPHLIKESPK